MKIFASVLLIIFNLVIIQSNNEYSSSTLRNEAETASFNIIKDNEEKCYAYCFNIVQPVLEHTVNIQVKDEQIQEQATSLKKLEDQIADFKMRVAIYEETIKNKDLQLGINEETIRNNADQLLACDRYKNETEDKINIIASKDELLSKTNEKLIEYKVKLGNCQAPNCIGKLTDIYEIKVPGTDAFSVPCDSSLAGSGWTVIQRRKDGSVDFNRNWTEYRQGFGDLHGEFFIGLDKLHLITKSQTHELYIYMKDFDDNERYAKYDNFYIGDEDELYKIKSIGSYSGNAGDSMDSHKNTNFSTPERDNDSDKGNCGLGFKSGWWFTDCYMCNLNGLYDKTATTQHSLGIKWIDWSYNSLKFVQMMIRPKYK